MHKILTITIPVDIPVSICVEVFELAHPLCTQSCLVSSWLRSPPEIAHPQCHDANHNAIHDAPSRKFPTTRRRLLLHAAFPPLRPRCRGCGEGRTARLAVRPLDLRLRLRAALDQKLRTRQLRAPCSARPHTHAHTQRLRGRVGRYPAMLGRIPTPGGITEHLGEPRRRRSADGWRNPAPKLPRAAARPAPGQLALRATYRS